jgi:DNA-binding GntR family transcriptional regulator
MTFHMVMATISAGVTGERMIRYLFELLYLKNRSAIMQTSPRKKFGLHHREILTFLKKNDVESAREALAEHITQVRDDLLESIDQE